MLGRKVTMADIAKALNVSNVTVSKALANKDGVGETLREEIKRLAVEMGYIGPVAGRERQLGFKEGKLETIGFIVRESFVKPSYPFYWTIYKKILDELKSYKYYGLIEVISKEDEIELRMPQFLEDDKVDGVIILGAIGDDYLEKIMTYECPLVMMDSQTEKMPRHAVLADNYYSMGQVMDYLFEMGHKDIGYVGSVKATSNIRDRYFGYYKALVEKGIEPKSEWVIEDREDMNFKITFELPETMPTAFFCNCDETAYHFVKWLTKQGYRVPEEVSVVGFYDYIYADMIEPKLTTVHIDLDEMAKSTVDCMMEQITQPTSGKVTLIQGSLKVRGSVKPL